MSTFYTFKNVMIQATLNTLQHNLSICANYIKNKIKKQEQKSDSNSNSNSDIEAFLSESEKELYYKQKYDDPRNYVIVYINENYNRNFHYVDNYSNII